MDSQRGPDMKPAEFRMFADLVRGHCGLNFDAPSACLLESRVVRRMQALDLDSFGAYHYRLRNGPGGEEELAQLVDDLTTNETWFFRELDSLRTLIEEILPEIRRQRPGPLRAPVPIWSAGCASGEEPYSIVMLALEAGLEPGRDFRVYASDVSRGMLQRARRGLYRAPSFREADPTLRRKYFLEREGGLQIRDEVKKHVDFIHLNLLDRSRIALLGMLDVVLCRNVIIYFDRDTKQRVIQTFYEKLRPGGHLLLGHSESLLNLSTAFELRHLRRAMIYRRPGAGEAGHDPWQEAAREVLAHTPDESGSR